MTPGSGIESILERQARFWEVRERLEHEGGAAAKQALAHLSEGPWVTVSKQWGSGGEQIAREVADSLHWQAFDRELLDTIAGEGQCTRTILARLDEQAINSFNDYLTQLLVPEDPGQLAFLQQMARAIWGLGRQGNAVIVGRGANWVLRPRFGLRVRVVAGPEWRAARIAASDSLDPDGVRRRLREHDESQVAFTRQVYGREIDDPTGYDLIVNAETLNPSAAVPVIITALREKLQA